jgi:hypothetical protein
VGATPRSEEDFQAVTGLAGLDFEQQGREVREEIATNDHPCLGVL